MKREGGERSWEEGLLVTGQNRRRGYAGKRENLAVGRGRAAVVVAGVVLSGVVLAIRLAILTLAEGGRLKLLAEGNSVRQEREKAKRGEILDRYGLPFTKTEKEEGIRGREYLLGEKAAHLVGYLSETKEEELGCREGLCYQMGDLIGRNGVEREFEGQLKGKEGGRLVEVEANGRMVRELGANPSEAGQDLVLSVDQQLQRVVAEAMAGRKGAVVALSMQGKLLALYSAPSFNPNLFTAHPDEQKLQAYLADSENQVFLNRVSGGEYPPGSVFKLVTAYAALESGKIDGETKIEDTGEIKIDKYRYGNWYYDQYGRKEGEIGVVRALSRSNDIFFYKIGEQVGVDELIAWAKKFGLGEPTGIELEGEQVGLVPSRLTKERQTGEKWFLGNTYHLSIGQGDLLVTPLQVARMTVAAVSGRLCRVSLLKDKLVQCEELGLASKNLELVREGMREACAEGGVAFPFFEFAPYVLCKTGTAQHAGQERGKEVKPHAWITLAYPGENPELVLVVMLEEAGEGSYEAAPVAKAILEQWQRERN